jgi:outer membrane protein assembly factor BamE (lipoprotein component of BamABCDE complex)
MKQIAIMVLSLFALTSLGCGSHGNTRFRTETGQTIDQKISKGVTTREQIYGILGPPDNTNFTDSGLEIWKYAHATASSKGSNFIPIVNLFSSGMDIEKKELTILFDDAGVVRNYTFLESKSENRTGIVPQ